MNKICVLTSVHSPFDIRIFHKQAKSLVREGYDVTLIAQHDNDEIVDGVKIIGLKKPRNRFERMTRTTLEVYQRAIAEDAEVYHFHDPELMPVGLRLRRRGKKVIYDIHEDTRQQIIRKKYIPAPLRFILSCAYAYYENYACRRFSALVTPQHRMTEHYSKLNSAITVENYVDLSLYPHRMLDFTIPVLFHAGALGEDRGLFNMQEVAIRINKPFLFYIAGKLPSRITADDLKPLIHVGILNQQELIEFYRKSNIGIILYHNVGQYGMAGAVKCYEYMANAMPIILPDFGEWPDFNKKHQCGINVNVLDPAGVADAIAYLVENPEKARRLGENGRKSVEENCSWQLAFEKLHVLYRKILEQ